MAHLSKPEKPLKILTIDGGGLQGISSLLILDKLLNTIAKGNGVTDSKPRPCDVFDVIAGIGPGGWLALLLGRFQMDITSALAEWYNLLDCITPNSKTEEMYMRLKQHCTYDRKRLIEKIDNLTKFYETDEFMFSEPPEGSRCKHVFVSALKTDSKDRHLGYDLFRTYDHPEGLPLLDGPDPHSYKISHAFGATGAAKYFSTPWKETSMHKGNLRYHDTKFPSPHNITELALNEMWGLYGEEVGISVVVNIGPGIPNKHDCKTIARRFSWGLAPAAAANRNLKRMSGASIVNTDVQKDPAHDDAENKLLNSKTNRTVSHRIEFKDKTPNQPQDADKKEPLSARPTFGSERHVSIEEKLKRSEDDIEDHIREKLRNVYPQNTPPYYRLAPDQSAPGTTQNDTAFPKVTSDATKYYLNDPRTKATLEEVGQKTPFTVSISS